MPLGFGVRNVGGIPKSTNDDSLEASSRSSKNAVLGEGSVRSWVASRVRGGGAFTLNLEWLWMGIRSKIPKWYYERRCLEQPSLKKCVCFLKNIFQPSFDDRGFVFLTENSQ